jgi:hypothetical protein
MRRGERKREEERTGQKSIYSSRISLCIPATGPAEHGFRPNLSNPHTYTGIGLIDLAENQLSTVVRSRRPIPADRPDSVARLQSPAGERERERERERARERERESSKREMTFVLKRE